jgi:hypothetical protein
MKKLFCFFAGRSGLLGIFDSPGSLGFNMAFGSMAQVCQFIQLLFDIIEFV